MMYHDAMFTETLTIYTDGSYSTKTDSQAYGWLVEDCPSHLTQARVVSMAAKKGWGSQSTVMESADIIDALAEFQHRNMHLVIKSDSQALAHLVRKVRSGEADANVLLNSHGVLTLQDGLKLIALLKTVSFEIEWVKAHSNTFANLVIDQALRIAALEGEGDGAGLAFVTEAMAARRAVVRGAWPSDNGGFYTGACLVAADDEGAAHLVTA